MDALGSGINTLLSKIKSKGGLARTNRFEVTINADGGLLDSFLDSTGIQAGLDQANNIASGIKDVFSAISGGEEPKKEILHASKKIENRLGLTFSEHSKTLNVLCEKINIPSVSVQTFESETKGRIEKYPYQISYGELTMEIIVCGDMAEKKVFDIWLNHVLHMDGNFIPYRNKYVIKDGFTITQLGATGNRPYKAKFFDIYPTSIGSLNYNKTEKDAYHLLPITFAFSKMKIVGATDVSF